jgi:hypothetical protein
LRVAGRLCATATACAAAALAGGSAGATEYPIPPPQGKGAVSGHVSGKVTVQPSNKKQPVSLQSGASVPSGSKIDASNGTATLVVNQRGKFEPVAITGGKFLFTQNARTGRVVFKLDQALTGCPSFKAASHKRAAAASVRKRRPRRRGTRNRSITVSDSGGKFGTQGQYVATSTEGTRWRTTDSCGFTTVTVYSGKVRIRNLVTGRLITIGASQQYTAYAHR